ncbi:MAG: DEAD/DEAH box helicase, partial [Candidatus Latescibacteria bacterium]|nr:DEAD/DEAH box helicase [Candidatus Latescibacterota bacterium]
MRDRLPRAYPVLLGRFPRLTEIQRIGIDPILLGRDVLLAAPTATGKTEAYAAPLAEAVLAGDRGGFRVLVVSPTRALANDLARRLAGRMEALGIAFGRHTGEHKKRFRGKRPEFAVTTPEALDSLLSRRPEELEGVSAVVLDEIHVLDGTVRGDQLRILLHRLERASVRRPQRIAASATVADPEGLAARYLSDAETAVHRGRRPIRARAFRGRDAASLATHLDLLARSGFRKVLAFCERREDVERHASEVHGRTAFGENVFAHHGSLGRRVRERAEKSFLERTAAVAFATLTLELGIDIGSVDYVLLLRPPPGVASLLQRIGRGSRRTEESRVGYVFETEAERETHRALLSLAAEGELAEAPYAFRPSVLVQQALSLAGRDGWVTADGLAAALPPEVAKTPAGREPEALLYAAADAGWLEAPRGGRFVLSGRSERMYDRGLLHSSFEAPPERDVVDRLTGEVIGRAELEDLDRKISLGGRGRRIVIEDRDRILVDPWKGSRPPKFVTHGRPSLPGRTARAIAGRFGAGPLEVVQAPAKGAFTLL